MLIKKISVTNQDFLRRNNKNLEINHNFREQMKKNYLLDGIIIFGYVVIFISVILMFSCIKTFGQKFTQEQLKAKANNPVKSNEKVWALNELCWGNRIKNQREAIKYGLEAAETAESIKFYYGVSTANINLAYIYTRSAKFDEAMQYYIKAMKALERVADAKRKKINNARVYEGLGMINYMKKDYPRSIDYYEKALNMFKESGLKNNVALCYRIIGKIYDKSGNRNNADENYYKELKTAKKVNYSNDSISSYLDFESLKEN